MGSRARSPRGWRSSRRRAPAGPRPYTIQAAIAAEHSRAERAAETDWPRIVRLYSWLAAIDPSPVVELNRAVAVAMVDGPEAGLALVDAIDGPRRLRALPRRARGPAAAAGPPRRGAPPTSGRSSSRGTRWSGPTSSGAWPRCGPANLAADANHARGTRGDPRQASRSAIERASLATACLGAGVRAARRRRRRAPRGSALPARAARLRTGEAGAGQLRGPRRPRRAGVREPLGRPPSQGAKLLVERGGGRRRPRPTWSSPTSRTRCSRSRPATPSCARRWPRSASCSARSPPAAREFQRTFGR